MVLSEHLFLGAKLISIKRARTAEELLESSGLPVTDYALYLAQRVWDEYVRNWGKVPMIKEILATAPKKGEAKPAGENAPQEGVSEGTCDSGCLEQNTNMKPSGVEAQQEVMSG